MEHLQRHTASVTQLGEQMMALKDQLTPSHGTIPPASADDQQTALTPQALEPFIPIPAHCSGDLGTFSQFVHQCSLVFSQQPLTYDTSQAKIAFMSLLTRQAAAWSLAVSSQQNELMSNYCLFTTEMRQDFDHPVRGRQAVSRLLDLKQGQFSVAE